MKRYYQECYPYYLKFLLVYFIKLPWRSVSITNFRVIFNFVGLNWDLKGMTKKGGNYWINIHSIEI